MVLIDIDMPVSCKECPCCIYKSLINVHVCVLTGGFRNTDICTRSKRCPIVKEVEDGEVNGKTRAPKKRKSYADRRAEAENTTDAGGT